MKLSDILKPEFVLDDIRGRTKKDILSQLVKSIAEVYDCNTDEMVSSLLERESLASTGIGEGIAIPHGKFNCLQVMTASVGRSRTGLRFDALDSKPCHIFFLLLSPDNAEDGHLKALARTSMLLKNPGLREGIISARSPEEIYHLLMEYDKKLDE
jgi:nitrogen PTS system EIIA component